MRVLVLEDDEVVGRAYSRRLRKETLAVDEVVTLAAVRTALIEADYDCLVLDRYVPDGDALDLFEELASGPHVMPILVVSADGDADARVEGLRRGADDYLAKPARLDELAARVLRLLARAHRGVDEATTVVVGAVRLDLPRRELFIAGHRVRLPPRQYSVFEYLMLHRDRVVPTTELMEHCWDRNTDLFSNPVHSQVTRLRKAVRGVLDIASVHGEGYRVDPVDPPND